MSYNYDPWYSNQWSINAKSRINLIGHGLWSIVGNKPTDEFINKLNLVINS